MDLHLTGQKYHLLLEGEDAPDRKCQNKSHITEVMFMASVERPHYDYQKKAMFDVKIGIWNFVEEVTAKKNSVNRPEGTIETKPKNVDREDIRRMMMCNIIPAILKKMPFTKRDLFIQKDNDGPHVVEVDKALKAILERGGRRIKFLSHPPNSPDLNALDLGFLNLIQSLRINTQWIQ